MEQTNHAATRPGRGPQLPGRRASSTRWVELVFGLLIAFGGGVVIYDSVRIGAKWASDGPQAGYFPWLTGLRARARRRLDRGDDAVALEEHAAAMCS